MEERGRGLNCKDMLMVLACVVIIALLCILVYNQYNNLQTARATVEQERQELQQQEERLERLEDLKENEAQIRAQLAYLEMLLPDQPKEDEMIQYLQGAADLAGIHFLQVRFLPRVEEERLMVMPMTIGFEGRYQEMLKLLEVLRIGNRLMRVEQVRIGQGREGFPQIRVEIIGSTFYRR